MNGQPKPAFYIAVGVVVILLLGLGIWRLSVTKPNPDQKKQDTPDIKGIPQVNPDPKPWKKGDPLEPTGSGSTEPFKPTVEFTNLVGPAPLPPVQGVSAYKPLSETGNTVRFAINTWAGWAPIILANEGFKAGKVWKTPGGKEFKVELVKIDDIVPMRDAYTSGAIHIGWATLDMVPLLLQGMVDKQGVPRDTRIMPRICQQIDWSSGGDGIVVRSDIKTVADLKGKKVVLAENSPSQYFLLRMLVSGGVQPKDVQMVYTRSAFEAASAFNALSDVAACVSWAPDIYKLTKVQGNRMLVTTAQANKLIADVWFARADFARDNPDILDALVRGIFDAMTEMNGDAGKDKAAGLMAAGFELPKEDAVGMLGDAHLTNWAENADFFLNPDNLTNFKRTWDIAYSLYSHPQVGSIKHVPVPADQVLDYSFVQKLAKEEKYAKQVAATAPFPPLPTSGPVVEGPDIIVNKYYLRFLPSSNNLFEKVVRDREGKKVEELYDPNVNEVLEKIANEAAPFGGARIIIEGHADSSMKTQVPASDLPLLTAEVQKLSERRAEAVKQALVEKFKFNPNQITPRGLGWSRPADPANPGNQAANRRVEVRIVFPEKE